MMIDLKDDSTKLIFNRTFAAKLVIDSLGLAGGKWTEFFCKLFELCTTEEDLIFAVELADLPDIGGDIAQYLIAFGGKFCGK